MIPQPDSQNDTTSRLIHSVQEVKTSSLSTSITPSTNGFSRLDIAVARVAVKKMIKKGVRKGPSDYLLLFDSEVEKWFDEEAIRYLEENLKKRQANA